MANHLFEVPGGRKIGISAAGDPLALRLVVLCHPTPGAGGFDPDPLVTSRWGVHLLSIDRPGYGASEPLAKSEDSSYEARADDIAAFIAYSESVAQSVSGTDFGRIGVVGWQSGGLTALALAARHPRLVDRLAIIDTPSPANESPVKFSVPFSPDDLGITEDDPVLERPGLRNRLSRMLDEASLEGDVGLGADLDAFKNGMNGAQLSSITATTKLIYGDGGQASLDNDGHWFHNHIPHAASVSVRGGGTLSIATQWERILEHVAPQHGGLSGKR